MLISGDRTGVRVSLDSSLIQTIELAAILTNVKSLKIPSFASVHVKILLEVTLVLVRRATRLVQMKEAVKVRINPIVECFCDQYFADIDECTQNYCAAQDICVNTRGGYKCKEIRCPHGYIRDPDHKR